MAESSLASMNIPQLVAVAVVGFLAVRWFLAPSDGSTGTGSSSTRGQAVDLNKIEQVAVMFPQLDRRAIAWDLHRNGQSVPATTERILSGRGLDVPPPSYQPNIPSPDAQAPAHGGSGSRRDAGKSEDLITRYGLQSRVAGKGKEPVPSEEQKQNSWSSDKAARAEGLKRRREEMILQARRKLEAKDAGA